MNKYRIVHVIYRLTKSIPSHYYLEKRAGLFRWEKVDMKFSELADALSYIDKYGELSVWGRTIRVEENI